jgi:hypothetical protein
VRYLKGFVRFWYDFIIGDDWTVAAGVIVLLGTTRLVTARGVDAWWLMPMGVILLLGFSLFRSVPPR